MKVGLFYEHQLPQPWEDGSELKLFSDALEQIELADRLGFDYMWEVEHHFLEEYSHSSAPEAFLGAVSQRTKTIRISHGICLSSPNYNHPARMAERLATLDLVSGAPRVGDRRVRLADRDAWLWDRARAKNCNVAGRGRADRQYDDDAPVSRLRRTILHNADP
ncbi:LLM class flavin-dependent oxidoreductase [Bradyrhizobium sp. BRP22]|nr:LLM class flavin-dependent oxidoreductase [Bradyrhizobium sp. BRP22]